MSIEKKLIPLREKLQLAMELELSTIPPYLVAGYSLIPGSNAAAAKAIRSVAMEEMLHMLLAGNILTAIGGSVKLGASNVPVYPLKMQFKGKSFKNREFDINLAAFTRENLEIFLRIELPEFAREDAMVEAVVIPGFTIGEFYNGIKSDLYSLCEDYGAEQVFIGNPDHQLSPEYFWKGAGSPIVVRNLQDAFDAIDLIVEQGEGTVITEKNEGFFSEGKDIPHYYRFKEVLRGRYYQPGDDPLGDPSGEELTVDYDAVFPIRSNCKHTDYIAYPDIAYLNNVFNSNFSMMLSQLEEGFNGNSKAFYTAILNGMRNMGPIAESLMGKKIPGTDFNACPTFEWIIKY